MQVLLRRYSCTKTK